MTSRPSTRLPLILMSVLFSGSPQCFAETGPPSKAPISTSDTQAGERGAVPGDQPRADESPEQRRRRELVTTHGIEIAEAILAGIVLKGMSLEQVQLARGLPNRKDMIPPHEELWHYDAGEVAFANGKVSYVALAPKLVSPPVTSKTERERQRQPERVETRADPGKQPSAMVSVPPVSVGDSYIYESKDLDQPELSFTTKRTVTAADGRIVLSTINLNNKNAKPRTLTFNREWNLINSRNADNSGFDYSPPLKYYDFPLYPGKSWEQSTSETNIKTGLIRTHRITGTVFPWEDVVVPAGSFRAIKVSLETELYDPSTGQKTFGTDISWYVPEVHRSVKSITTGKDGKQQVIQLLSYEVRQSR